MKLLLTLLAVLALAAPASAQSERPLHIAVASYMTLQGADLAVTSYMLGARTAREVNPILAPFSHTPVAFGAIKMGMATATSYGILRLQRQHPKLAFVLAVVGSGVYVGVVYHNARLLQSTRMVTQQ
jgi:hypothetical protein